MRWPIRMFFGALILTLLVSTTSCSLVSTQSVYQTHNVETQPNCSRHSSAPVVDGVLAGFWGALLLYHASEPLMHPDDRAAGMLISAGLGGLHLVSMAKGRSRLQECQDAWSSFENHSEDN